MNVEPRTHIIVCITPIMSRIHDLLSTGVLDQLETNSFKCKCGKIIRKNSIPSHLKSKAHLNYMNNVCDTPKECGICYLPKTHFFTCQRCKNQHCVECHPHMTKCPFCRTEFTPRPRRQPRMETVWLESEIDADIDALMTSNAIDLLLQVLHMVDD